MRGGIKMLNAIKKIYGIEDNEKKENSKTIFELIDKDVNWSNYMKSLAVLVMLKNKPASVEQLFKRGISFITQKMLCKQLMIYIPQASHELPTLAAQMK